MEAEDICETVFSFVSSGIGTGCLGRVLDVPVGQTFTTTTIAFINLLEQILLIKKRLAFLVYACQAYGNMLVRVLSSSLTKKKGYKKKFLAGECVQNKAFFFL